MGYSSTASARTDRTGPVAQLVSAPPCHGGGRGFESRRGRHPSTPGPAGPRRRAFGRHHAHWSACRSRWNARSSSALVDQALGRHPRRDRVAGAQRRGDRRGRRHPRTTRPARALRRRRAHRAGRRAVMELPDRIFVYRRPLLDFCRRRRRTRRGGPDHRRARGRPPLRDRRRPAATSSATPERGSAASATTPSSAAALARALADELGEEPGLERRCSRGPGQREQPLRRQNSSAKSSSSTNRPMRLGARPRQLRTRSSA